MEKTIRLEIPETWLRGLDPEHPALIQEVLRLGIYQLKVKEALEVYKTGDVSLGYAAERAGIDKRDLAREARSRGIEPAFDEQVIAEELSE